MKRNKKSKKKLPRIFDESRGSPKNRMQHSSDFGKNLGRNKPGIYHQGGYETENVISPDNMRNDIFKFGSTYDSGFEHGDHHDMMTTGGQGKKKKKYTYATLKANNDTKSRSVSSNLGRLDHTCFI